MSDIVSYCRTSSSSVRQSNHSPQAQRSGACAHAQAPGGPKLGRLLWRWRLLRGGSRTEMGRVGVVDHGLSMLIPLSPLLMIGFPVTLKVRCCPFSLFPVDDHLLFITSPFLSWFYPVLSCSTRFFVDYISFCKPWSSTARARSHGALPDLNRELQISVGTAGPQQRTPDLSGPCRTSTASARLGTAVPQLREPDVSRHCGTFLRAQDVT
jgi:hypothetical protein